MIAVHGETEVFALTNEWKGLFLLVFVPWDTLISYDLERKLCFGTLNLGSRINNAFAVSIPISDAVSISHPLGYIIFTLTLYYLVLVSLMCLFYTQSIPWSQPPMTD